MFQVPAVSTSRAHAHLCSGQRRRSTAGAPRKREGDTELARSHERERWTRKLSGNQETTPGLQTLSADRSPVPVRNTPDSPPRALLKDKDAMLLAPQTRRQPKSQKLHSVQKKGEKTQAGCKLFESFMRRGIFPVIFFFLFKVCFKIKRARERS